MISNYLHAIQNSLISKLDLSEVIAIDTQEISLLADAIKQNTSLNQIVLPKCIVQNSDAFKKIISAIKDHICLQSVHLIACGIDKSTIDSVAQLISECPRIEILDLSNNKIDDFCIGKIVTVLRTNTTLKKLYLNDNLITINGISELLINLKTNTSILLLNVKNNPVQDNVGINIVSLIKAIQNLIYFEYDNEKINIPEAIEKILTTRKTFVEISSAIYKDDSNLLNSLMEKYLDLNEISKIGMNPLHLAAFKKKINCLKLLLASNAIDVSIPDSKGNTAFYLFLLNSKDIKLSEFKEILIRFKEKKADINAINADNFTVLHIAVCSCDTEKVEYLVNLFKDSIQWHLKDTQNATALHHAIVESSIDKVQVLVGAGALVKESEAEKNQTLILATQLDDFAIYNFLNNESEKPSLVTSFSKLVSLLTIDQIKAFETAIKSSPDTVFQYKSAQQETLLMLAFKKKNTQAIKLLLKKNVSLEDVDAEGNTLLQLAVQLKDLQILEKILQAYDDKKILNLNINRMNLREETPLHSAIAEMADEVAQKLINKGAALNCKDSKLSNSLHLSIIHNRFELFKFILEEAKKRRQLDEIVTARNILGETILHQIINQDRQIFFNHLLQYEEVTEIIDTPDDNDNTPLHLVYFLSRFSMLEGLLSKNIDVSVKNGSEMSVWQYARDTQENSSIPIKKLLNEYVLNKTIEMIAVKFRDTCKKENSIKVSLVNKGKKKAIKNLLQQLIIQELKNSTSFKNYISQHEVLSDMQKEQAAGIFVATLVDASKHKKNEFYNDYERINEQKSSTLIKPTILGAITSVLKNLDEAKGVEHSNTNNLNKTSKAIIFRKTLKQLLATSFHYYRFIHSQVLTREGKPASIFEAMMINQGAPLIVKAVGNIAAKAIPAPLVSQVLQQGTEVAAQLMPTIINSIKLWLDSRENDALKVEANNIINAFKDTTLNALNMFETHLIPLDDDVIQNIADVMCVRFEEQLDFIPLNHIPEFANCIHNRIIDHIRSGKNEYEKEYQNFILKGAQQILDGFLKNTARSYKKAPNLDLLQRCIMALFYETYGRDLGQITNEMGEPVYLYAYIEFSGLKVLKTFSDDSDPYNYYDHLKKDNNISYGYCLALNETEVSLRNFKRRSTDEAALKLLPKQNMFAKNQQYGINKNMSTNEASNVNTMTKEQENKPQMQL